MPPFLGKSLQAQATFLLLPQLTWNIPDLLHFDPQGSMADRESWHISSQITKEGGHREVIAIPVQGNKPGEVRLTQRGHTAGTQAAPTNWIPDKWKGLRRFRPTRSGASSVLNYLKVPSCEACRGL